MTLIDTNILARYLLNDIPDQSVRCHRLFREAARGQLTLFIPSTVFAEITWLLIRQRNIPRQEVIDRLLDVTRLPNVVVENDAAVVNALNFLSKQNGLSFVDCYHLALAKESGMTQIYTFDKKMDRYPGVERIEPE